eukprot:COSAG03_NODE_513_length_7276_cov_2.196740_4_plen_323_part_00
MARCLLAAASLAWSTHAVAAPAETATAVSAPGDRDTVASWGYASQRAKAAAFLQGRFDPQLGLLQGVWAGGHGYEPLGFSLIDVNFFAQHSLRPYNPSMADAIGAATSKFLARANYSGDDRRENMFGTCVAEILTVDTVTVEGGYPAPPHKLWMVTERVNRTRRGYTPDRPFGVNAGVTMALSKHLSGDTAIATAIMTRIASWWNASSLCIMEPAAVHDGFCYTRALAYFLFGVRALRLPSLLPAEDMVALEEQLWRVQAVNCSAPCNGGMALSSTYSFGGAPMLRCNKQGVCAHSSTEPANLALLAYDPRIQTTWFPSRSS